MKARVKQAAKAHDAVHGKTGADTVGEQAAQYAAGPRVDVQAAARALAKAHMGEPGVKRVFWAPHGSEIRLVEVADDIPADDTGRVVPYYFSADPKRGISYVSGIAMVTPAEEGHLSLPEGWGDWRDLRLLGGIQ